MAHQCTISCTSKSTDGTTLHAQELVVLGKCSSELEAESTLTTTFDQQQLDDAANLAIAARLVSRSYNFKRFIGMKKSRQMIEAKEEEVEVKPLQPNQSVNVNESSADELQTALVKPKKGPNKVLTFARKLSVKNLSIPKNFKRTFKRVNPFIKKKKDGGGDVTGEDESTLNDDTEDSETETTTTVASSVFDSAQSEEDDDADSEIQESCGSSFVTADEIDNEPEEKEAREEWSRALVVYEGPGPSPLVENTPVESPVNPSPGPLVNDDTTAVAAAVQENALLFPFPIWYYIGATIVYGVYCIWR